MIDLSFIGKDGLIIQYEDVISVIGFNIIRYMIESKQCTEAMSKMSLEDILLSYLNRETYDIDKWIHDTFDINFHYLDAKDSVRMVVPNFIYAYKILQEAKKQNISSLYIYSNEYYKGIERMLSSFEIPGLQYLHGGITPFLQEKPNITYITSDPNNIKACLEVETPFVLTIVDDFIYIKDIVADKIDEKLRKQGKFVFYTGILSGGLTNVGHN